MPDFELVVPAYNEADTIETLIREAVQAAKESNYTSETFQFVVVENGSSDNSLEVLNELKATPLGQWFRTVAVERNQGYGHGLWSGLQTTTAPHIGWSHADLQCHPRDAFRALELLKDSEDGAFVKGTRRGRNPRDVFVSRVFELLARAILGVDVNEINAQPKIMSRGLLDAFVEPPMTFAFDLYALYKAQERHLEVKTITVDFPPRLYGSSKWAATLFGRYKTILGMVGYMWRLARSEGRL